MTDHDDQPERRKRSLTDDDVAAIVDGLEERILSRMYLNAGKGILSLAWRAFLLILVALAIYGVVNGSHVSAAAAQGGHAT